MALPVLPSDQRYFLSEDDSGISVTLTTLDGSKVQYIFIDPAKMIDGTDPTTSDYVFGSINGNLRKVTLANLLDAIGGFKLLPVPIYFPGTIDSAMVANANNKKYTETVIEGEAGKTNTLIAMQITRVDFLANASGTTSLTASDESLGTTNTLVASIGPSESFSTKVTKEITLGANPPKLYVRVSSGGGHSGVHAIAYIRVT